MPRLEEALRRAAASLDLPPPERTRILEEIAADLEELLAELLRRGVPGRGRGARGLGCASGSGGKRSGGMRRVLLHDHQTRRPARRHAHE